MRTRRRNPFGFRTSDLLLIGAGLWVVLTPSGQNLLKSVTSGQLPFLPLSTAPGAGSGGGAAARSSSAAFELNSQTGVVGGSNIPSGGVLSATLGVNHIGGGGAFLAGVKLSPQGAFPGWAGAASDALNQFTRTLLPFLFAPQPPASDAGQQVETGFSVSDDGTTWGSYAIDLGSFAVTVPAWGYDVTAYVKDLSGRTMAQKYLGAVKVG